MTQYVRQTVLHYFLPKSFPYMLLSEHLFCPNCLTYFVFCTSWHTLDYVNFLFLMLFLILCLFLLNKHHFDIILKSNHII